MPLLQLGIVLALLIGGGLLAAAMLSSRRAQLRLAQHVDLVAAQAPSTRKPAPHPPSLARPSWLDESVRRAFCIGIPHRWGMRSGTPKLLLIAATCAAISWFLAYRMSSGSAWAAGVLSAAAFVAGPRLFLRRERKQAERQFIELFPNSIDMMVRMMRAGLPITSAVQTIGVESPPPLDSVFESVADQVGLGVPFETALDVESERLGIPDFRFFSVAVTLQHATGGNLAATLDILSDLIRRRRAVRLKAIAATAEVRISAYVLAAIPVLTIGALLALRPGYIAPLLQDRRGNYILAAAAGLLLLAFLTMRQMMRRVTTG